MGFLKYSLRIYTFTVGLSLISEMNNQNLLTISHSEPLLFRHITVLIFNKNKTKITCIAIWHFCKQIINKSLVTPIWSFCSNPYYKTPFWLGGELKIMLVLPSSLLWATIFDEVDMLPVKILVIIQTLGLLHIAK